MNVSVPCPPIEDQIRLVRRASEESAATLAVIPRTQREIELLREFRTRLTSDVVTGQLDVRHIAATLPDLEPTSEPLDVDTGDEDGVEEADELLEAAGA
jgi:type I restriction enzyme S subunit